MTPVIVHLVASLATAAMTVVDMSNWQLKHDLMNLSFRDPRKDAKTANDARLEIERLEELVAKLEKQVSDASWEADRRRADDEIARSKEWR